MKKPILLFALLFIESGAVEVTLKDSAVVGFSDITVTDVVKDATVLTKNVSSVVVAKAAPAGYVTNVGKKSVLAKLMLSMGRNESITVLGPDFVKVRSEAAVILGQKIRDAVRNKIYSEMPWKMEDVRIDFGSVPDTIVVPAGSMVKSANLPENCSFRNTQTVQVVIENNAKIVRKIPITARIRIFRPVCVALTRINRNAPITESSIRVEKREVTELSRNSYEFPDSLYGKVVDRTIIAGKILTDDYIKPEILVRGGEKVKIVASENEALVSVEGEALRDGAFGDKIPVRSALTGKRVSAFVVSRSTVSVVRPAMGGYL